MDKNKNPLTACRTVRGLLEARERSLTPHQDSPSRSEPPTVQVA
jgi:hypothetical protein